jgi:hypothetical protein
MRINTIGAFDPERRFYGSIALESFWIDYHDHLGSGTSLDSL